MPDGPLGLLVGVDATLHVFQSSAIGLQHELNVLRADTTEQLGELVQVVQGSLQVGQFSSGSSSTATVVLTLLNRVGALLSQGFGSLDDFVDALLGVTPGGVLRSEERRVGREWRSRWELEDVWQGD